MRISLTLPPLNPLEVVTERGTFLLRCRRPTDAEILLSDQVKYAERVGIWLQTVEGWDKLEDDDGNAIRFTEDALHQLMAIPEINRPVCTVLFNVFNNSKIGEQAEKNSGASDQPYTADS